MVSHALALLVTLGMVLALLLTVYAGVVLAIVGFAIAGVRAVLRRFGRVRHGLQHNEIMGDHYERMRPQWVKAVSRTSHASSRRRDGPTVSEWE